MRETSRVSPLRIWGLGVVGMLGFRTCLSACCRGLFHKLGPERGLERPLRSSSSV